MTKWNKAADGQEIRLGEGRRLRENPALRTAQVSNARSAARRWRLGIRLGSYPTRLIARPVDNPKIEP